MASKRFVVAPPQRKSRFRGGDKNKIGVWRLPPKGGISSDTIMSNDFARVRARNHPSKTKPLSSLDPYAIEDKRHHPTPHQINYYGS
jgi:hypothetical protein